MPDSYRNSTGSSRDDGRGYGRVDRGSESYERNRSGRIDSNDDVNDHHRHDNDGRTQNNPWGEAPQQPFKRQTTTAIDDSYYSNPDKRQRRDGDSHHYSRERGSSFGSRNDKYDRDHESHYQRNRASPQSFRNGDDWNRSEFTNREDNINIDVNNWQHESFSNNHRGGDFRSRIMGHNNEGIESEQTNDSEEIDEFGRKIIINKVTVQESIIEDCKKPIEWPTCFETHGEKYILDTRSGMFYESESDFFYDPRSKLYYGNKKQLYFKYNPDNENHFEPYASSTTSSNDVDTTTSTATGTTVLASSTDSLSLDAILESVKPQISTSTDQKSKAFAITLKTKVLKSKTIATKNTSDHTETAAAAAAAIQKLEESSRLSKVHQQDISKWTGRQVELRNNDVTKSSSNSKPTTTKCFPTVNVNVVSKTTKGDPMCIICRRKFPTMEKLDYHIKVSTLHKENLAQLNKSDKSINDIQLPTVDDTVTAPTSVPNTTTTPTKYVDRALQRRIMHGGEASNMIVNSENAVIDDDDEPVNISFEASYTDNNNNNNSNNIQPGYDLNESNIGNKMLQKLGWKGGTTLGGRINSSEQQQQPQQEVDASSESPVQVPVPTTDNAHHHGNNNIMAKEWARIESIASSNNNNTSDSTNGLGRRQTQQQQKQHLKQGGIGF